MSEKSRGIEDELRSHEKLANEGMRGSDLIRDSGGRFVDSSHFKSDDEVVKPDEEGVHRKQFGIWKGQQVRPGNELENFDAGAPKDPEIEAAEYADDDFKKRTWDKYDTMAETHDHHLLYKDPDGEAEAYQKIYDNYKPKDDPEEPRFFIPKNEQDLNPDDPEGRIVLPKDPAITVTTEYDPKRRIKNRTHGGTHQVSMRTPTLPQISGYSLRMKGGTDQKRSRDPDPYRQKQGRRASRNTKYDSKFLSRAASQRGGVRGFSQAEMQDRNYNKTFHEAENARIDKEDMTRFETQERERFAKEKLESERVQNAVMIAEEHLTNKLRNGLTQPGVQRNIDSQSFFRLPPAFVEVAFAPHDVAFAGKLGLSTYSGEEKNRIRALVEQGKFRPLFAKMQEISRNGHNSTDLGNATLRLQNGDFIVRAKRHDELERTRDLLASGNIKELEI